MIRHRQNNGATHTVTHSSGAVLPAKVCLTGCRSLDFARRTFLRAEAMSANPVKPGVGLPPDLWVGILSFLPHADLGRALCTSRAICDVSQQAWRAACYRRWPRWAAIAAEPGAKWRRVYELLSLREDEASALVDVPAIRRTQTLVNEGHRAILTEWLCEVRPPARARSRARRRPAAARPAHAASLAPAGLLRVGPRVGGGLQGRRVPRPLPHPQCGAQARQVRAPSSGSSRA